MQNCTGRAAAGAGYVKLMIMVRLLIPARRTGAEMLDAPETIAADLAANLRDIRRLNRWTGGRAALRHALFPLLEPMRQFRLLDIATGSGDLPLDVLRYARRRGIEGQIVGLDVSEAILAEAAHHTNGSVEFVAGDARSLPFVDSSFDVVMCCLALHHFECDSASQVLREMWRVTRDVVVVVDLTRSYPAWFGAWLGTHTLARNHVTKHDALLSVLRSYTPAELAALAQRAGIDNATIRRRPFFRQTLVARRRR